MFKSLIVALICISQGYAQLPTTLAPGGLGDTPSTAFGAIGGDTTPTTMGLGLGAASTTVFSAAGPGLGASAQLTPQPIVQGASSNFGMSNSGGYGAQQNTNTGFQNNNNNFQSSGFQNTGFDQSLNNFDVSAESNLGNEQDFSNVQNTFGGSQFSNNAFSNNGFSNNGFSNGFSSGQSSGGCSDQSELCCFWASMGECDHNPFYMKVSCSSACGTCGCSVGSAQNCPTQINSQCSMGQNNMQSNNFQQSNNNFNQGSSFSNNNNNWGSSSFSNNNNNFGSSNNFQSQPSQSSNWGNQQSSSFINQGIPQGSLMGASSSNFNQQPVQSNWGSSSGSSSSWGNNNNGMQQNLEGHHGGHKHHHKHHGGHHGGQHIGGNDMGNNNNNGNCADSNPSCPQWAQNGECDKNPFWMKPNCQKSCNFCGQTVADVNKPQGGNGGCSNQHELCSFWESIGECNNNSQWMHSNCAASCHAC